MVGDPFSSLLLFIRKGKDSRTVETGNMFSRYADLRYVSVLGDKRWTGKWISPVLVPCSAADAII